MPTRPNKSAIRSRLERAVLGALMSAAAFVLEKRLRARTSYRRG
jgi:hypothetical protein